MTNTIHSTSMFRILSSLKILFGKVSSPGQALGVLFQPAINKLTPLQDQDMFSSSNGIRQHLVPPHSGMLLKRTASVSKTMKLAKDSVGSTLQMEVLEQPTSWMMQQSGLT